MIINVHGERGFEVGPLQLGQFVNWDRSLNSFVLYFLHA